MIPTILLVFSLTIAVGSVYVLIRNSWVYSNRIRLLWGDYPTYKRLPSYGAMMWRFWIWDVRAFLPGRR